MLFSIISHFALFISAQLQGNAGPTTTPAHPRCFFNSQPTAQCIIRSFTTVFFRINLICFVLIYFISLFNSAVPPTSQSCVQNGDQLARKLSPRWVRVSRIHIYCKIKSKNDMIQFVVKLFSILLRYNTMYN